jgi:hypothetical protein
MERGAALADFVSTVIDSVSDIAHGGLGGVPAKIEGALGKAVPLVISFLANLLGLGGISEKIKSILETVQKPVGKAVDAVIKGALKVAKPLIAGMAKLGQKAKAKLLGGDDSPEGKKKRLGLAMQAGIGLMNRFAGKKVGEALLKPGLGAIRMRYGITTLEPKATGRVWELHGHLNPTATAASKAAPPGPEDGGLTAPEGKVEGAYALYRGIHYEKDPKAADPKAAEKEYREEVAKKQVGTPTFSAAARELAGSKRNDGSDVPPEQMQAAVELVQEALANMRKSGEVKAYWTTKGGKDKFENLYLALLHRFAGQLKKFKSELANPPGSLEVPFKTSPFISTSKKAEHAVRYAQGKLTEEERKRIEGVVGRVFVYLFDIKELAKQHAANLSDLSKLKKIAQDDRKAKEGEVTFTGAIPGQNLVDQMNVGADRKKEDSLAMEARAKARAKAAPMGGLLPWMD